MINPKHLFCISLLGVSLVSCQESVKGRGPAITANRNVAGFDEVHVAGSMDVQLSQGSFSVSVEAQENLMPYIETYVDNGRLIVTQKDNTRLRTNQPMIVRVSLPEIEALKVSGSGELEGQTLLRNNNRIRLEVSGSGQLAAEMNAPVVVAQVSGSGTLAMQGQCRMLEAKVTGSGNMDANDLKAESVDAKVAGSGDLTVFGSRTINAHVTGSGDLSYTGGGTVLTRKSGSGSIRPL